MAALVLRNLECRFWLPDEEPPARWWPYLHFQPHEIRCKGTGGLLQNHHALLMLDALRATIGRPIFLTSAYRSLSHNENVGGADGSYHLQGRAFDITATIPEQEDVVAIALAVGFKGIGRYQSFVHVDNGPRREWGR